MPGNRPDIFGVSHIDKPENDFDRLINSIYYSLRTITVFNQMIETGESLAPEVDGQIIVNAWKSIFTILANNYEVEDGPIIKVREKLESSDILRSILQRYGILREA